MKPRISHSFPLADRETAFATATDRARAMMAPRESAREGPFDGEEASTPRAGLNAGPTGSMTGSMTGAMIPDLTRPVIADCRAGDRQAAIDGSARARPAINPANRHSAFSAARAAMVEGGAIASDFHPRPIPPLATASCATLLRLLRPRDPIAPKWGQ